MTDKIDIVYLWVDGADKKWRTEKDKWLEIMTGKKTVYSDAAGEERFRDNGELLYSLRSVAECVPWIHHIYIITGFNQKPKWLNIKHPKITIVPHEQIMPHDALPTFHSNAIEMCIPNIPNLSEKFILMNDDTFFNKPLSPSFFFDKYNRARVHFTTVKNRPRDINKWLSIADNYGKNVIRSAKIIEQSFDKKLYFGRPSHGIDPYLKSSWLECAHHPIISEYINKTIYSKFRSGNVIQRWTFNLYDLMKERAVFIHARAPKYGRHKILNFIYNLLHWHSIKQSNVVCTNAMAAKFAIAMAPTFCINDAPENTPKILQANRLFLNERFPNKCEFEK